MIQYFRNSKILIFHWLPKTLSTISVSSFTDPAMRKTSSAYHSFVARLPPTVMVPSKLSSAVICSTSMWKRCGDGMYPYLTPRIVLKYESLYVFTYFYWAVRFFYKLCNMFWKTRITHYFLNVPWPTMLNTFRRLLKHKLTFFYVVL